MFDIHCHILHGFDDGSDNLDESVSMARLAVENGTKAVIVTPHCNIPDSFQNHFDKAYAKNFLELKERIAKENIPLKIFPGQEIFAHGDFLQLIKNRQLITLNNSVYPLIEFDFFEHPEPVFAKLEMLVAEGYVPIVAHPERYDFVQYDEEAAEYIKKTGCLIQLNKGSITGKFGRSVQHTAHRILESRLADFVASDAHSPYMRTPRLDRAHEIIGEMYSYDYAQLLLRENPVKVIQNKIIRGDI